MLFKSSHLGFLTYPFHQKALNPKLIGQDNYMKLMTIPEEDFMNIYLRFQLKK